MLRSPTSASRSSSPEQRHARGLRRIPYGDRPFQLGPASAILNAALLRNGCRPIGPALSFLQEPVHTGHTREYLRGFSCALARAGIRARPRSYPTWILSRIGALLRLERHLGRFGPDARIVAIAWPRDGGGFPDVLWSEVIPVISDCWPDDYDRWTSKLRRMRSRVVFVSARGSADHLRQRLPDASVYWLPEAINPDDWDSSRPLAERQIDVLELGRHHPEYHRRITAALDATVTHRFAAEGSNTPIFEGFDALRAGLADARIQVCFPRSITHPDAGPDRSPGAQGLETVTQRYFEAIASGSLVVGAAPAELVDLFGYNPVITADLDQPAEQLRELIETIEDHQPFVDRNLARLREVGTWDARVHQLLDVLAEHGYETPAAHRAASDERRVG